MYFYLLNETPGPLILISINHSSYHTVVVTPFAFRITRLGTFTWLHPCLFPYMLPGPETQQSRYQWIGEFTEDPFYSLYQPLSHSIMYSSKANLGMVPLTYNPSTWEMKAEGQKFKVNIGYIVSSRPARAT